MPGSVNPCCKPIDPCFISSGFNHGRYAFVLVLFILLVIVGTAYWC
ncbi:MAG: YjcZ family sporulation protein [Acholeplasmataceae bacterium]|nr:YjcZ family sporulation protein [Acholeplasmataceae bacterium]